MRIEDLFLLRGSESNFVQTRISVYFKEMEENEGQSKCIKKEREKVLYLMCNQTG